MENIYIKVEELQEDKDELLQTLDYLATGRSSKKKFTVDFIETDKVRIEIKFY